MNIEQITQSLLQAEQTKEPIRPLTEVYDDLTPGDAYRIQLAQIEVKKQ